MGGTELTQYIIFAVLPKGKGVERRVIEGATSIKGARQKAYRAAKRYPEARYIGIQTVAKYHQPYSEITVKVRMGEDGKIYANRKELKSTGEFYTDRKKTESEDIFAWYKGESTPKPKKEQPANLMSSKFMRDHIIIAQPKPVKRAPTGFNWQMFNERFNHYYKEMYEGRLDMSREWVEKGDRILQTKKEFVSGFVKYRQDFISSDRETAALARTYDYFRKKGMITDR